MALLFMDSMDLYGAVGDVLTRWDIYNGGFQATFGRYGGKSLYMSSGAAIGKLIPATGDSIGNKLFMSAAVAMGTVAVGMIAQFADSLSNISSNAINLHLSVQCAADGKVALTRGTTVIATSASVVFAPNIFYRIEIGNIYIHDTAGTAQVRVDGVLVIDFTGDTRNSTTSSSIVAVGWGGGGPIQPFRVDDVMIWSSAGATPNGVIGDFRIDLATPNSNGSTINGTPVGVASAYLAVDEVGTPNNETDYVLDATAGNINLFGLSDLVGTPTTIFAVGVTVAGRSDNVGTRSVQAGVKSGATTGWSGEDVVLPAQGAYAQRTQFFPLDPATGVAWTPAAINAMEAGYKVTV